MKTRVVTPVSPFIWLFIWPFALVFWLGYGLLVLVVALVSLTAQCIRKAQDRKHPPIPGADGPRL